MYVSAQNLASVRGQNRCVGERTKESQSDRNKMNRDRVEGSCRQIGGRLKEAWGRLNHDPVIVAAGRRDRLAGRVQERRGISRQLSDRQLDDFMRRNRNWWNLTGR